MRREDFVACLVSLAVALTQCRRGKPHGMPDAALAPAAVPVPRDAAVRAICSASAPIDLAPHSGTLLGIWRDPRGGSLTVAEMTGLNRVALSTIAPGDPTHGPTPAGEVLLPAGVFVIRAWRAHDGDVMITWLRGSSLRVGRVHGAGTGVQELDFVRLDHPAGYRERALGPLDDPSDSTRFGISWGPARGDEPATLCAVQIESQAIGPCFFDLPSNSADALARTAGLGPGATLFVHPRRANGIVDDAVLISNGPREVDRVGTLGAPGVARLRRVASVGESHSGPMMIKPPGDGMVAWVQPDGGLRVQSIDAFGRARGEPTVLPFTAPELNDAAPFDREITGVLSIATRADRAEDPATSTLVWLDLAPADFGHAPVDPMRIGVPRARLVPLGGGILLAWSNERAHGVLIHCGLPAP